MGLDEDQLEGNHKNSKKTADCGDPWQPTGSQRSGRKKALTGISFAMSTQRPGFVKLTLKSSPIVDGTAKEILHL